MRTVLGLLAFTVASTCASLAGAQDASAQVEALFADGKRLANEGKYADACPKFLASYNLEHRVGTLLNLADCYEKNGQLASSWARFVEAKQLATRANQLERAEFARQHATELEPKLSSLVINVPHPSPDMVVHQDHVIVEPAVYGVSVHVDAGDHLIDASAPGKVPWSTTLHVAAEKEQQTLDVPELKDAPKTDQTVTPLTPIDNGRPVETEKKRGPSGRAVVGITVAAAGVAGIGVGIAFGAIALSKYSDSNAFCGQDGNKNDCTAPGIPLRHDAVVDGNVSTVLLGVGAACLITGVIVWVTAPSARARAAIAFDGRVVSLRGTF